MGALFSSPELPPTPPAPPPPPDSSDEAVQQSALAQAQRMSSIGYKGSFRAGARGEGPQSIAPGEATTPANTSAPNPKTEEPPPWSVPGIGGQLPPQPGETIEQYRQRVLEWQRANGSASTLGG